MGDTRRPRRIGRVKWPPRTLRNHDDDVATQSSPVGDVSTCSAGGRNSRYGKCLILDAQVHEHAHSHTASTRMARSKMVCCLCLGVKLCQDELHSGKVDISSVIERVEKLLNDRYGLTLRQIMDDGFIIAAFLFELEMEVDSGDESVDSIE